jgi:hypothetical protein
MSEQCPMCEGEHGTDEATSDCCDVAKLWGEIWGMRDEVWRLREAMGQHHRQMEQLEARLENCLRAGPSTPAALHYRARAEAAEADRVRLGVAYELVQQGRAEAVQRMEAAEAEVVRLKQAPKPSVCARCGKSWDAVEHGYASTGHGHEYEAPEPPEPPVVLKGGA